MTFKTRQWVLDKQSQENTEVFDDIDPVEEVPMNTTIFTKPVSTNNYQIGQKRTPKSKE